MTAMHRQLDGNRAKLGLNRSGLDLVELLHGFPTLVGEVADEVLEVLRVELLHQRREHDTAAP